MGRLNVGYAAFLHLEDDPLPLAITGSLRLRRSGTVLRAVRAPARLDMPSHFPLPAAVTSRTLRAQGLPVWDNYGDFNIGRGQVGPHYVCPLVPKYC